MTLQDISGFEFESSLKIRIHARYRPTALTVAYHFCNVVTLGLLSRFCTWFPRLEKHLFTLACSDFQEATHVFVHSSLGSSELIGLKREKGFVIFDYYGSRFLLQESCFVPLSSLPRTSVPHASLLFGPNEITFTRRSYIAILHERILSPYNLFQGTCMMLWALQGSWIYVYVIASVTSIATILNLKEAIETQRGLRKTTKIRNEFITMNDGSRKRTVDLLPGDLICLSLGPVPADVVLRSGAVLVDEAMLNGESAGVAKTGTNTPFDSPSHPPQPQNTVYAGTLVKSCTEFSDCNGLGNWTHDCTLQDAPSHCLPPPAIPPLLRGCPQGDQSSSTAIITCGCTCTGIFSCRSVSVADCHQVDGSLCHHL